MFLGISLFAATVGVVLAAAAALMPETGVDGTAGAFVTLAGAVAVAVALVLMASQRRKRPPRPVWSVLVMTVTVLTALAAWFLMQNALVAVLVVSLLAQVAHSQAAGRTASA